MQSIASNRWTMSHSYDFEHMLTRRTTTGTAVFHMDAVAVAANNAGAVVNAWPDDFRDQLMIAVPDGFTRTNVDITVSEDGSNLKYVLTDEQQTLNLASNSPITHIDGWYDYGVGQGRTIDTGKIIEQVGEVLGPRSAVVGRIAGAIAPSFVIPKFYKSLNVAVWGRKNCPRQALVDTALAAATAYGFEIDGASIGSILQYVQFGSAQVRVNIVKKVSMVSFDRPADLVQLGTGLGALSRPIIRIGQNNGVLPDDIVSTTLKAPNTPWFNAQSASGTNPPPPYSNASRGYYLGSLVAQIFATSGTRVTVNQVPANERRMTDRS